MYNISWFINFPERLLIRATVSHCEMESTTSSWRISTRGPPRGSSPTTASTGSRGTATFSGIRFSKQIKDGIFFLYQRIYQRQHELKLFLFLIWTR